MVAELLTLVDGRIVEVDSADIVRIDHRCDRKFVKYMVRRDGQLTGEPDRRVEIVGLRLADGSE